MNCRNIALLLGFPLTHSPNSIPHSGMDQKQTFLGLPRPNPSKWVPAGPKGNSLSWEQAWHLVATSHSPCCCPGTGTIPRITLQLLTATTAPGGASLMDHLWPQWHVQWPICSAGQWPPADSECAASSQSGNLDVARRGREEKSHLFPSKLLSS